MAPVELVYALSLFAAVCVAVQVLAVERGFELTGGSAAFTAALVSIVASVVIFWAVLLARGVPDGVTVGNILPFAVAGVLNPAAFRLLYFEGIDRVGARIAATIQATYPAIATIVAVGVLGETISFMTGAGIALIVVGAGLLQFVRNTVEGEGATTTDLIARELASIDPRDTLYPAVATVLLGLSYVLVEYGLTQFSAPAVATTTGQTTALVVFVGLMAVSGESRQQLPSVSVRSYLLFTLGGVAVAALWLSQFFALNIGSVSTVVPLVSSGPLFVVAFSYALAREVPRSGRVVVGILGVVAGVILIQLG